MKKNISSRNFILSIETSVQGGSISILENERELLSWHGSSSISRSEDLLDEISLLLERGKINKNLIKRIVISTGPGSFTGTRIGLSTAFGLSRSLGCEIIGASIMEAMALQFGPANKIVVVAIPVGNEKVCVQNFMIGSRREVIQKTMPQLRSFESFLKLITDNNKTSIILFGKNFKEILNNEYFAHRVTNNILYCDENLAYLLARQIKFTEVSDNNLQAIYVKDISK